MATHNYSRVIPRDLFNEANLMKCLGKLYLELERLNLPGVRLEHENDDFVIEQDPDDGSITMTSIHLAVADSAFSMFRPLNSREPWPLYVIASNDDEVPVFNDDGTLSPDMLDFIGASDERPTD